MGSVTWKEETTIAAAPDAVFAWMSDFTEDDHNTEAFRRGAGVDPTKKRKPSRRTILSREGNVLRIRDEWGGSKYEQTVTLDPTARTVLIQGGMGYESTWRASPEGAGTRLSVEGRMGRGIVGTMMRLFEGGMRKSMAEDFRGHVEDLRDTLRAGGKGT